jgi:hypothetical protein
MSEERERFTDEMIARGFVFDIQSGMWIKDGCEVEDIEGEGQIKEREERFLNFLRKKFGSFRTWKCQYCNTENDWKHEQCVNCGSPRKLKDSEG